MMQASSTTSSTESHISRLSAGPQVNSSERTPTSSYWWRSFGDVRCSIVTIINSTVLYTWNLLRDLVCCQHTHKWKPWGMDLSIDLLWKSVCNILVYQIMLYTLNLNILCQICLNKARERKSRGWVAKPMKSESLGVGLEYLHWKTAQRILMFLIAETYFYFAEAEGHWG